MKISTKGRYALRMMLELARPENYENNVFISLKEISDHQHISKKYLEQIVPLLNTAEFLVTNRGYLGGYRLARRPSEYTVADILRVTEGNLAPVSCLEGDIIQCPYAVECPTLSVWKGLNEVINNYLNGVTLQDILDDNNKNAADFYSI